MKQSFFMSKLLILLFLSSSFSFASSEHYDENSLNWPMEVSQSVYRFGPLLHQYQKFPGNEHYFHGGSDLVGEPYQDVFTPVSGIIDGGYYKYDSFADGSSIKSYVSIKDLNGKPPGPEFWGDRYFEISLTDIHGTRFEFHHVDPVTLPRFIKEAIFKEDFIFKGTKVGNIIPWPNQILGVFYNHIHYNILSKDGTQLNPFWFSKKVPDSTAPKVDAVYFKLEEACPRSGLVDHYFVRDLKPGDEPTDLVIKTTDRIDDNRFPHAPTKIVARFSDGSTQILDFSYELLSDLDINAVYEKNICLGPRSDVFTITASKNFDFYMKIPIPENFSGQIDVEILDYAQNKTNLLVNVQKEP